MFYPMYFPNTWLHHYINITCFANINQQPQKLETHIRLFILILLPPVCCDLKAFLYVFLCFSLFPVLRASTVTSLFLRQPLFNILHSQCFSISNNNKNQELENSVQKKLKSVLDELWQDPVLILGKDFMGMNILALLVKSQRSL